MASDRNINLLNEMTQENTEAIRRTVDPIMRLNQTNGSLASVQADNLNEVRYLRNSLLQQTNVANRLKDSITKADKINTKALGQSITLKNIVDKNSAAVEQSRVGYLRAAEMFVDNFAAGIRQTTGGTLKLSEQLILTGQNLDSFRNVNNRLLSQSGRNYDAIGDFNDAILETAETYVISTDTLLKGVEKLMKDIDQFSLFGPDVAEKIAAATADTTGKLAGLNNEALQSFFKLLKPGLEGRATRELLGLQRLQEQMARGDVDGDMIANSIMDVGRQLESIVAGRTPDVGVELLKARGLNPEDSAAIIGAYRTLQSGDKTSKDLLATQKEQTETIVNQTELANKYYQRIAPMTLNAVTSLIAPTIMTAQILNGIAAAQEAGASIGSLAGFGSGSPKKGPSKAAGPFGYMRSGLTMPSPQGGFSTLPPLLPGAGDKLIVGETQKLGRGFSRNIAGLKGTLKTGFSNVTTAIKGPLGIGAGAAIASMISSQFKNDSVIGKSVENAGEFLTMAAVGKTLVPGLDKKGSGKALGVGALLSLADPAFDYIQEKGDIQQGTFADSVMDVERRKYQFAQYGSIGGFLGMAIGGAAGFVYGAIEEILDVDGDRKLQKEQLDELKKQNKDKEREATQLQRAKNANSDFALMALVNKVQESQSALLNAGNEKTVEALNKLTEAVLKGNQDRKTIDAGRAAKDLTK